MDLLSAFWRARDLGNEFSEKNMQKRVTVNAVTNETV